MRILSVPVATPRRMRRSSDRSRPRLVRFAIIDVGFRNTRAPRGPLPSIRLDSFNSAGSLVALDRMKGRESVFARGKRARARAACTYKRRLLTCPCCSAVPPLLDCSPWTDSCCCIHSSVSLQAQQEEAAR